MWGIFIFYERALAQLLSIVSSHGASRLQLDIRAEGIYWKGL